MLSLPVLKRMYLISVTDYLLPVLAVGPTFRKDCNWSLSGVKTCYLHLFFLFFFGMLVYCAKVEVPMTFTFVSMVGHRTTV